MKSYLFISIGAVAGAVLRYHVGEIARKYNPVLGFPWGTFFINVSGSFLLGLLMASFIEDSNNRELKLLLTTGFCGAYTTFSTFSYELISLIQKGEMHTALLYAFCSMVVAPLVCFLGLAIAK